ncbi:hypothetical protein [Paenibacillus dendrobii]|uniref:hypothetical protein n=1 Tax=Paenibacillus dendrobii TaxID=2691084 RepID=UPI001F2C505F|nr:hypothetical protein [Paenibacillus dendrobii]
MACTLLLIGCIVITWPFIEDAMNNGQVSNPSANPNLRHLTEAERQQILDTTDAIVTKYGTFKRTTTTQPLPDKGVVYDTKYVNKNTKVIIKDGRRFDRVPDGSKF